MADAHGSSGESSFSALREINAWKERLGQVHDRVKGQAPTPELIEELTRLEPWISHRLAPFLISKDPRAWDRADLGRAIDLALGV